MAGLQLPKLGFGTWQLSPEQCVNSVQVALEVGYRHIDTAQIYKNEHGVGEAIEKSPITREEISLATKIWITKLKSASKIRESLTESLKKLRTDYVDLLYVHWPAKIYYKPENTLPALAELVQEGQVRHIGLSNFTPPLLDEAQDICPEPIAAVQVEHHPFLQQRELRAYLEQHGITLVAYSPLARSKVLDMGVIQQIAEKHSVSEPQVSLAWLMAHGAHPIPKATSEAHIRDNFKALDLKLDPEDILSIDGITQEKRLLNPPILRPKW